MMNRVVLVGRLTKDVELKYTPSGVPTAKIVLAVNRTYTNHQGEREADFINCVLWRKPAENAAKFLAKGSLVGVDGKIQTRNFEGQDGKRVYITEVNVESIQFLDTKKDNANNSTGGNRSYSNDSNGSSYGNTGMNDDPFANDGKTIDISDDDLPF